MANTPETQRNVPTGAPSKAPSDTLLKNFRATLDTRWTEFDIATMREAEDQKNNHFLGGLVDAREQRDKDPDFLKAKKAFNEAISMLANIKDDTELKANTQVLVSVESTLKSLTDHLKDLKPEEKGKAINIILAKTTADLSQFKADITGKDADKKEAEVASAAEKAIPRVAVVATVAGGGLLASAEAKTAVSEIKTELTEELKKELGPWGMIFQGVKGVSPKEVATQVKDLAKEYHDKKWTEDPFDKLFAMIQLFFLKMQIGRAGMDLSKDMTPEEMKLAGIKGGDVKNSEKKGDKQEEKEGKRTAQEKIEANENVKIEQSTRIANHLIRRDPNNKNTFSSWLDAGWMGVVDSTWGQDKKEQKNKLISAAGQVLTYPKVREQSFDSLKKLKNSKTPGKDIGIELSPNFEQALSLAISSLVYNESWIDGLMKSPDPKWREKPLGPMLDTFYTTVGFKKIHGIQTAIKEIDWSGDVSTLNTRLSEAFLHIKDGQITGLLAPTFANYKDKGVDTILIQRIFQGDEGNNLVSEYRETLKNKPFENIKSQEFVVELTKNGGFSKNVVTMMSAFGFGDTYTSALRNGEGITMQELLTLYMITGGNTDIQKMSPGQRTEVFMLLYGILGARNVGTMAADTIIQMVNGTDNEYMKEALEFVGTQINETTYVATLTAMGVAKETIDSFLRIREQSPKTFYFVIGGIIASVIAGVYLRKPIVIAGLITMIIAAGAKIAVGNAVTSKS